MNNSNYKLCLTATVSKILALFFLNKSLMHSHVTRNAVDDLKNIEMFCK